MGFLLITNDIDPYYQDAVNVIAQCYGSRYRFRYEVNPTAPQQDLVRAPDAHRLRGSRALVVFRQWATGVLVPLRQVQIVDALVSSYFVVAEFVVQDFCDPEARPNWSLMSALVEGAGSKNPPGAGLRPLVFPVSDSDLSKIQGGLLSSDRGVEDLDRWRSTIESIAQFDHIDKVCFLYLHTIRGESGAAIRKQGGGQGLALDAGETYDAEIAQYMLPHPGLAESQADKLQLPLTLMVTADPSHIVPVRATANLVSRYDNVRFSVRPQESGSQRRTILEFGAANATSPLFVPTIATEIYVRFALWRWVSLLSGLGLYLLASLYEIGRAHV